MPYLFQDPSKCTYCKGTGFGDSDTTGEKAVYYCDCCPAGDEQREKDGKAVTIRCFHGKCDATYKLLKGKPWPPGWSLHPKDKPKDPNKVKTYCPRHGPGSYRYGRPEVQKGIKRYPR